MQDWLDALLARNDAGGTALRTLYDEYGRRGGIGFCTFTVEMGILKGLSAYQH